MRALRSLDQKLRRTSHLIVTAWFNYSNLVSAIQRGIS